LAYIKTNWLDDVTPISSTNMNKIEQGIFDLDGNKIYTAQKGIANGVTPLDGGNEVPILHLGRVIPAINAISEQWELLAIQTFGVDTLSCTFSGLSSVYKYFKVRGHVKSGGIDCDLEIKFNGSSVGYKSKTRNNITMVDSSGTTNKIIFTNGVKEYGNAGYYEKAILELLISNYETSNHPVQGTNRCQDWIGDLTGNWYGSAYISSITLTAPTEKFDTDSVIQLYGCQVLA